MELEGGGDRVAALRRALDAFNRGEIDVPLALMCEDVDWPNTVEGGRLEGRESVRAYWTRMFKLFIPRLEPVCMEDLGPQVTIVCGRETFTDTLSGQGLTYKRFRHLYTWRGGLVARLEASEPDTVDAGDCEQAVRGT